LLLRLSCRGTWYVRICLYLLVLRILSLPSRPSRLQGFKASRPRPPRLTQASFSCLFGVGSLEIFQRGNSFQRRQGPRRRSFQALHGQSVHPPSPRYNSVHPSYMACHGQEKIAYHTQDSGSIKEVSGWRWRMSSPAALAGNDQLTPHWDNLRTVVVRVRLDPWALRNVRVR